MGSTGELSAASEHPCSELDLLKNPTRMQPVWFSWCGPAWVQWVLES